MNDFVEDGQKEFQDALKAAQAIITDKDNAMVGEIETAETNLLNAMLNLRYKADKSILEALLAEANDKDANAYTAESYAVLQAAVAKANEVMGDENASQEEEETAPFLERKQSFNHKRSFFLTQPNANNRTI